MVIDEDDAIPTAHKDGIGRDFHETPVPLLAVPDCPLALSPLSDVDNGRQHLHPFLRLDRIQADLDRELSPIPPETGKIQACSHRPRSRCMEKPAPLVPVLSPVPLRQEHLDLPSKEFLTGITELLLHKLVDHHYSAGLVHHHHPRLRCLHHGTEPLFGNLSLPQRPRNSVRCSDEPETG